MDIKFVIAALYWPESKIPLEMWNAAPSTSNRNEQAHRNANQDGIKLTFLAAIMRGLQLDTQAAMAVNLFKELGIFQQDQQPTYLM